MQTPISQNANLYYEWQPRNIRRRSAFPLFARFRLFVRALYAFCTVTWQYPCGTSVNGAARAIFLLIATGQKSPCWQPQIISEANNE
jgi:hypothetical protein